MNLTARAMVALALAVLVCIVAQWTDSLLADFLWRALVALVVLGLAYELIVTRRAPISATWAGSRRLRLGRSERLELHLESGLRRALTIELAPRFPAGIRGDTAAVTVALAPASAAVVPMRMRAVALGPKSWPALPARLHGPLDLAAWSRRLVLDGEVDVRPDLRAPSGERVAYSRLGAAAQGPAGGSAELHHLRPYRPGDPRNAIDWKATARTSQLITRVFSEDQHLEIMLLVDAGRTSRVEVDGMSQLGHYVNLAVRFAQHGVAMDDQVGLLVFADRPLRTLRPGRQVGAVTRIRNALSDLNPSPVESDVLAAALHVRNLVRHRCLVVILTDLNESSATGDLARSARLLSPTHLPLIVGLVSEEVVALAERPARDWLDPYHAFAAREYRRSIAANVARLERLGAQAVAARPSELDDRVLGSYRRLRAQRRI